MEMFETKNPSKKLNLFDVINGAYLSRLVW